MVKGEYAKNAHRKDFSATEMVAIRREVEFMDEVGSLKGTFEHLQPTHAREIVRTFQGYEP